MLIKTEGLLLYGRLIDAEFPDYAQAIPKDSSRHVTVERNKFMQALKRIMLMSGKDFSLKAEFHPCSLVLSSCTPDLGNASEEMAVEYRSEKDDETPFAIALNAKFLLDILETLEGEKVHLQMESDDSPVMIEEGESVHILMPLQLYEMEPQAETQGESESTYEPEPEQQSETEYVKEVGVN